MNILKKIYLGKHFPSDLGKLPYFAVKDCMLSEIFSGFFLEIIWNFSTIQVLHNRMRSLPYITLCF